MTTPRTTVRQPPPPSQRKSDPDPQTTAPAIERRGEVWHLRSYRAVRQVLRDADATRQAGFNAELAGRSSLRQPVLFQDGAEHREQRTAIARFFTPKTVDERYRTLMTELSDTLVHELRTTGSADLDDVSLALAVEVAARVVGLTNARRPGMAHRLEAVLSLERLTSAAPARRALALFVAQARMWWFYRLEAPDLRAANADVAAVGEDPPQLRPQRELGPGVQPAVLSFGDGAHRCPGAFIAIQESDVFLQRLLRLPLDVVSPPQLRWNALIESYEPRGFRVAIAASA